MSDKPEYKVAEREVTCPYCGYFSGDSFEYSDSGEEQCEGCERYYRYERHLSVEYWSYGLCDKAENKTPHDWREFGPGDNHSGGRRCVICDTYEFKPGAQEASDE